MSVLSRSPTSDLAFDSAPSDRVAGTASGVSWGAVLAGAAGAAALSLILLILGVGLGQETKHRSLSAAEAAA